MSSWPRVRTGGKGGSIPMAAAVAAGEACLATPTGETEFGKRGPPGWGKSQGGVGPGGGGIAPIPIDPMGGRPKLGL